VGQVGQGEPHCPVIERAEPFEVIAARNSPIEVAMQYKAQQEGCCGHQPEVPLCTNAGRCSSGSLSETSNPHAGGGEGVDMAGTRD